MSEKIIVIKRVLKPKYRRKVSYNTTYKISIPIEWIQFYGIKKGQEVDLILTDNGFFIKLAHDNQQKESEVSKEKFPPRNIHSDLSHSPRKRRTSK
jgi:bifunctional DNA-binding transcriptional regulator/antitoxin component of YhaV-PrlF toxin-antitoxin module